ncbi:hypothetical protein ACFPN6_28520 [Streptomyces fimbriatus]|uniref:Uncharacterized protein n=1 Tax=Streptomyces fimbriatus TaxID=68197 RepID=A0ABW0DFZ3_STRFI
MRVNGPCSTDRHRRRHRPPHGRSRRAAPPSQRSKFLSVAAQVEKAAFTRPDRGGAPAGDEPDRLVDDLRLAQIAMKLTSSGDVVPAPGRSEAKPR